MRANNLKSLIKDEMVNRFEAVVSEEIKHHNFAVLRQAKEISQIKDQLNELAKQQKDIFTIQESLRNECLVDMVAEKKHLFEKFEDHRRYINQKTEQLSECVGNLENNSISLATHQELNESYKLIQSQLINIGLCIDKLRRDLSEAIFDENQGIQLVVSDVKEDLQDHIKQCSEDKQSFDDRLSINKIDVESLLKELRIYKRDFFIVEKKIENIYTLIERLSK